MKDLIADGNGESTPNSTPLEPVGSAPPRPTWSRIGGIVLGGGILLGGTIGYMLAQAQRSRTPIAAESRPVNHAAEARISTERQVATRRLATFADATFTPTDPPTIVLAGFMAPLSLSPPFEAIDSALFDAGETRIRLAGILPVGRQEVCLDTEGRRFACGLMGRATLQNFLARRDVSCTPLFFPKDKRRDFIDAECRADGIDIGEHVVRSGFAFPSSLAGKRLEVASMEAREAKIGVWRGPYLMPDGDAAIEDSREVERASLRTAGSQGRDRIESPPEDPPGVRRTEAVPERREATSRVKKRSPAGDAEGRPLPRPTMPPVRTAGPVGTSPAGKEGPRSGVVAGPILPPPETLARKLGVSPSTTGGEPGDLVRGSSDR